MMCLGLRPHSVGRATAARGRGASPRLPGVQGGRWVSRTHADPKQPPLTWNSEPTVAIKIETLFKPSPRRYRKRGKETFCEDVCPENACLLEDKERAFSGGKDTPSGQKG